MTATRPNVVLIVLDDLGFADFGCYGSAIETPNIDALAKGGLRYNRFHVTAICSPTRACLMTGRNQHAVGMGWLADLTLGSPGYTSRIPKSAATLPRLMRDESYSTFAIGKWHLTPGSDTGPAGPFDRWPLAMGFERYYGFIGAGTDQWRPELVRDNSVIDPPGLPADGYHVTEDLADQAIRFLHDQQHAAPGTPFFLYFATGAVHCPHQVGERWSDRYRGRFDEGWDAIRAETFGRQRELGVVPASAVLTPRPAWVTAWDQLSAEERRVYARMMEVYAGFLTHTDAQIGRVLAYLSALGVLENTLVLVASDNGASAEGGPHGYLDYGAGDVPSMLARIDELGGDGDFNHYAWGWAWAGNTPFRLWKRYSWLGGVRVPLVVHWPVGVPAENADAVCGRFCHAIDVMPTILDAAGVALPASVDGVSQQPLDGTSMLATFTDPDEQGPTRTQYFETMGSRSIYHDGWKATTDHVDGSFGAERELIEGSLHFETDRWSLFNLDEDFAEARDLAAMHPEGLRQLEDLWWSEAGRNQVLPLIAGGWTLERFEAAEPPRVRNRYVYLPGGGTIMTPSFVGRVDVEMDATGDAPASGIVCAHRVYEIGFLLHAGWACYALDGRVIFALEHFEDRPYRLVIDGASISGRHTLGITVMPGETADHASALTITLTLDGQEVGAGSVPLRSQFEADTIRWQTFTGKLIFGRDDGIPVSDDYEPPFPFEGRILRGEFLLADDRAASRRERDLQTALRYD